MTVDAVGNGVTQPGCVNGDRFVPMGGQPIVSGHAYAALATRNTEFYGDRLFDPEAIAGIR